MLSLHPAIITALLGTLWLVFLTGYFNTLPLLGLGSILSGLLLSLLCGISAYGWGIGIVRAQLPERRTGLETVIFAQAIGWGVISLLMAALGAVGGWKPVVPIILLTIGLVRAAMPLRHAVQDRLEHGRWPAIPTTWAILLSIALLIALLLAFAPVTYYDSLVYHMALPAAYIRAGHWIFRPEILYGAFPENLEMLWTFGLLLRHPQLPNLIAMQLAIALVLAVAAYGRRYFDERTGWVSAGLLSVMPAVLLLSSGGYVDVGLALYVFLSFYALCLWSEEKGRGPVILAGILIGLALGIKYTAGIPAVLGALTILWVARHKSAKPLILYGVSAFGAFLPWLIKNWIMVGNPVFPFLYKWGSPERNPWLKEAAEGYFRMLVEYSPHSLLQLPQLLWRVAVHGFDFGGGIDVLGNFGWAPLVAFAVIVPAARERQRVVRRLAIYAALYFAAWGMSRPVLRFLLPLAPVLALLAGWGWTRGLPALGRAAQWSGRVVLGFLLLSQLSILFQMTDIIHSFAVPLGASDRKTYLVHTLNYFPAADFVNNHTPQDATILIAGDQCSYYYERDVTPTTAFHSNPFITWANDAGSASDLRTAYKKHWSHLVINRHEWERLRVYGTLNLTPQGIANWEALLAKSSVLFRDDACEVIAL
jgi:hypothetical protein